MSDGRPGNPALEKAKPLSTPDNIKCMSCNTRYPSKEYYNSASLAHRTYCKVPICDDCLNNMYKEYVRRYTVAEYDNPERKAMERICMIADKYYSDKLFDSAMKDREKDSYDKKTFVWLYMKQTNMYQYRNRDYDDTIKEKKVFCGDDGVQLPSKENSDKTNEEQEIIEEAIEIFGTGFTEDDYLYLYEEYKDWTARHECNTKAQEELFKRLCFKQLDILKAERRKENTDKLDDTYQKLLQTANLQPRQNTSDTVSEAHTFGTMIDKWENTRPLPETDEELRDVDGIRKYINVFFLGHIAKMLGIENKYSDEYDEYMEQYTVSKPEYGDDSDVGAIYDTIFKEDEDV